MHEREQGDNLRAMQQDVQRRLGQCLLGLQDYERVLKALLAEHEFSGPIEAIEKVKAGRAADIQYLTLGTLVKQLLGAYLTTDKRAAETEDEDGPPDGPPTVSVRTRLFLSEDDFAQLTHGLKELVALRNTLVHHFISLHDLTSMNGCRAAQTALEADLEKIKLHYADLCGWVAHMGGVRARMAEVLQAQR
jgi:hypothetical protein